MKALDHFSFGDSCQGTVFPDFKFDFLTPDGVHHRGQASDRAAAKAAIDDMHNRFALACWGKGRMVGDDFVAPLK